MRRIKHVEFYIGLIAASALFLAAEHLTHWEFLLHLAAIPLEILVAVFIVERFLELRENKQKRQQLLYIKSYMFRSEMRNLFIANFAALKHPAVRLDRLRSATLEELKEFRRQAESIEYASPEAMEPVIKEYVKAEPVWHAFKERAITYNFESIFHDMIFILHFICDVKIFLEKFPHRLFIQEAAKSESLMHRTLKVLTDGIKRFLEYAVELKEKEPEMFDEMMADYALSIRIRDSA
jgi:hypothetical protein